jgi:predicted ATP-grasp superfamily ATP-dependent carboligase
MQPAGASDSRSTTAGVVIVAGVSTRAIAESAVRAGYLVRSVDAFGDRDHRATPARSLARDLGLPYSAYAAARASRALAGDTVAYVSSFENHPRAVSLLARGRTLLGNPPQVLARARDPLRLARILRAHALPTPDVRVAPREAKSPTPRRAEEAPLAAQQRWLAKPRASGGGHGIALWRPGTPLPRAYVLQERILGVPGSLAFVADGHAAVPFALSRQLVGDRAFGASGFAYCGSILSSAAGSALGPLDSILDVGTEIAHRLTAELGLIGANGIDFVVHDALPYTIELNPRYSASMELAERWFGVSVFRAHRDASLGSLPLPLPRFDLRAALRHRGAIGKAVLFARRAIVTPDTTAWLEDDSVRDIPHPGERIARGRPVCTIFATGRDDADCYRALVQRAQKVYDEIEGRRRRIA